MTAMQKAIASCWFVQEEDELSMRLYGTNGVELMRRARLKLDQIRFGIRLR